MSAVRALVVVESCFGNTAAVAEAVLAGLREAGVQGDLVQATDAPSKPEADLVVVAAPTHNMGLPSPSSRAQAARDGGHPATSGVREWLESSRPVGAARLVAVDTCVESRFAGSAAAKAQRLARRRGWHAEHGPGFEVSGTQGPLRAGELERARAFGRALAG